MTLASAAERLGAALTERYRIERELGQGGMATVYLAHDIKHDRKVAIKVLRPELAATLGHDRFLREITTTANLRHPHILPLYDSGEADGFLFYAMPFVEGESLRDRLTRDKQLPVDDALQIAREVADALSYAHGRGVIHRDIKPENILLESGHAVVADFGIARAVRAAGASSLTQAGMAIGTPAYMSPEQAAGESDLDARSDLYALGCVTYEMLAGQPPFTGATVASLIHQHLAVEPHPVTQMRSAVPAGVSATVQRALAKNPADRFASLSEFSAALRVDARSGPVPVPRRRVVGMIAAAAALAVAIVAWISMRDARSDTGLDPDVIAVLPFRVGGPGIDYLRESMLDLLQARLGGGTGPRTVEPRTLLAAWRRAAGSDTEDLSEEASRALATELGAGRVLLGSAIATPTELTLSGTLVRVADGTTLARESVAGAPDSIAVLVNRLTAALLIGEAGEDSERRGGLGAAPLKALQDYLAARKAYRRGDYFGAMDLYGRALNRDSTFADAAFGMVTTNAWIGNVFTTAGFQVIARLWRMRDRLTARDRDLFLAMPMVGPSYPQPSSRAVILAQAERAANAALDSPEPWMLLGQLLSRYGAVASRNDWAALSAEALDRAITLDSSFTTAVSERIFTAMLAGDRDNTVRLARLLEARVTAGFTDDYMLWAAATTLGDSVAARRWRDRTEGLTHADVMQKRLKLALHSAAFALPLDDARQAMLAFERDATTGAERRGASLGDVALRFASGSELPSDLSFGEIYGPGYAISLVQQGVIDDGYRALARGLLAREEAGGLRLQTERGPMRWPTFQSCFGQLYRITIGDTSGTGDAIRQLRAFARREPPPLPRDQWLGIDHELCPLLLEVLVEGPPPVGQPWRRLDHLDSLMHDGPQGFSEVVVTGPTAFANLTIARLREAQGDHAAALAAIRRREVDYFPAYLWSLPTFLRQEGRLAALVGDTTGALRAYDKYLTLRTDPMAVLRPQRDSVRAERTALISR